MCEDFVPGFFFGAMLSFVICIFAGLAISGYNANAEKATNTALLASCRQTMKLNAECRVVEPYTCRTDGSVMTCAVYNQVQKPAELVLPASY